MYVRCDPGGEVSSQLLDDDVATSLKEARYVSLVLTNTPNYSINTAF